MTTNSATTNMKDYDQLGHSNPDYRTTGRRGRLRIYLGMASGVGKTYAMLNEGRRRHARGTDVVIGFVETHNRPLTEQQIGDLEIVPRQKLVYRGATYAEMDVEAILRRQPTVALVDDLAHINAPGSRHAERYQDVEELLTAGIIVITTLNIDQVEGLSDTIEAITGIHQRQTIPDHILDQADEVEMIDLTPDGLRGRVRDGNVIAEPQIQHALEHSFSTSNLIALRELALRRTAEITEQQLELLMCPPEGGVSRVWAATATERVLVAFDGRPQSGQLLREGWRLASRLKSPLLAVTVLGSNRGPAAADAKNQARDVEEMIKLAEDLGAEVICVEGSDIAGELARIARERHVSQIVLGQPAQSRWHELLFGSVVNQLLRKATGAKIHTIAYTRTQTEAE